MHESNVFKVFFLKAFKQLPGPVSIAVGNRGAQKVQFKRTSVLISTPVA